MLQISKKGIKMPASPIRKLVPYAEQAKKKGVRVFHLNIGQPDIETPLQAFEALKNYPSRVVEYSHSAGNYSLRQKLCQYYERYSIHFSPEEIIVTAGASEALLITMQSILDDGDEIITTEPLYANYIGFSVNAGVEIVPITSFIENAFSLPNIYEFEKVISKKTKALLICNPNNPTGYLYSQDELEIIKNLALKYNLYIIADEVYREFVYDGYKHFSVMHMNDALEHVILIDSVSKRYSACGFRIGNIASKNKTFMNVAMKFAQARLSPPSFGQWAAEACLDISNSYFESIVNEYYQRRNVITEAINSMEGAYCPIPKGAFYVVARLPIDDADKFCQWLLEEFNYSNQTVMLAPASGFYTTSAKGKNEVRISYVLNVEELKKAMECLEVALKQYPGRIF